MNVIFTIRYFHPFVGGTEKQALTLASHLATKGVGVTILTSRFQRDWRHVETLEKVRVVRLCSPRIKAVGAIIFLSCLAYYLARHNKEYAIIHTFQIGYTSFVSILLGLLLRKPTLLKLASCGSGGDIQRAKRTPWGNLFLYMAKKASRIVAVSSTVKKELIAEGVPTALIASIANGVDTAHYNDHPDKGEMKKRLNISAIQTIIFTGRLSAEKGIDFLVRSFVMLLQKHPCRLIIIADGPERKNIELLIKQYKLDESVQLISAAENIAQYLAASDLFVLPSRFEGLSNSLLEAMASALPVISTRVGGSEDLIQDGVNGLLIQVDNEEQLYSAMDRILKDRRMAAELGENARATVKEKYAIGKITDAYTALYRELLTSSAVE